MDRKHIKLVRAYPGYCALASLEMALRYYGYIEWNQHKLARFFPTKMTNEISESKWGTHIERDSINRFFEDNKIALHETYIPINTIMDEYDFFEVCCKNLKDSIVICGYNYCELFGGGSHKYNHSSIITRAIDIDTVEIIDPGPIGFGKKRVLFENLYQAIKIVPDGLWCIQDLH